MDRIELDRALAQIDTAQYLDREGVDYQPKVLVILEPITTIQRQSLVTDLDKKCKST